MKIKLFILALLTCLLMVGAALAEQEVLHYYYLNACESCTPEEDFAQEFRRLTGQELSGYEVIFHNVFHDKGRAAYDQATAGFTDQEKQLPLLVMGDDTYAGTSSIAEHLETRFGVVPNDTRSMVYFLTATACESCAKARETVDQYPAIVPVQINGDMVASEVLVKEINVSTHPEEALALFRQYQVPDDQRKAPMILMGETYLAGTAAIEADFLTLLRSGAALSTPVIEPVDQTPAQGDAWSLLGALVAGITAGFNPCALSMLLLLMGVLLSIKKNIMLYGSLYLGGKLSVYLLIGLGFAQLWTRYAPDWLPLLVKIVMTVIGVALIVVNLMDAINARHQKYGKIRNQLPPFFRGGIRDLIKRSMSKPGKWLCISAILLGMAVAAGEFLCAGQLYVAVLIANTQYGTALPLIVYSLAFLLPSLVFLVVVALSRKTMDASDWVLKRMPFIKVMTALVMAVVLIYAWLAK